ncbi:phosphatase PAP2 family protein [Amycolatopsis oliviviridis]|uniref:Phosphatase PAP2 family protein n=1 Tax=Amycolatopsis oliviviridis TaxID=1471590 RepID=A0ABQ3MC58_9PSEU|nr:phosphatase PAP2 family protein [Amycolatopsis oliviviridis]GHH37966.1 phosphatase PAP2 family protein [Amycolatopsis oliviviridis]
MAWAKVERVLRDLDAGVVPTSRAHPVLVATTTAARGGFLWLVIAALLAARGGGARRAAGRGLVAAGAGMACGHLLSALVRRPRPPARDLPARESLPEQPSSSSFPSKHAATAAAFTVAVTLRSPRAGVFVVPVGVLVCYGRMRTYIHWTTDVLGGAALGFAIAYLLRRR